jgi:iron-sulfur cluster assembly protein
MLAEQTQLDSVTLTPTAALAVSELLAKRNLEGYGLRVFVSGGGCSGFQYGMALEGNIRDEDFVFDSNGVKVVVDEISISYLKGANVDYVEDLMGGGFKIENPNAVSTCGCGSSFRTNEGESDASGSHSAGCGSC